MQDTALVICPYCGQENEIALDRGGASKQDYEEDCQVCCRPWRVQVVFDAEHARVDVTPLDT